MVDKYNLDNIISKYIHRPRIQNRDLPPLYARSGSDNETAFDAEEIKDPDWQKAAAARYSSPTNVRRLFIGDKKVYIQYYQPPVGSTSRSCWSEHSIAPEDQLDQIVYNVVNYNQKVQQSIANGEKAPKQPVVVKTGLGAISSHWVMSNIEEIYITPSILVSIDIRQQFPKAEECYRYMQDPRNKSSNDLPFQIFRMANHIDDSKILRSRFPRLKAIVFITNIEQAMLVPGAKDLEGGIPTSLSQAALNWYRHANEIGALQNSSLVGYDIKFEDKNHLLNWSTRPGIYKYDADVLAPYVNKYIEKVTELGRQKRDQKLKSAQQQQQPVSNNQNAQQPPAPVELTEDEKVLQRYDARIHGEYYENIKRMIMAVWEDMYSKQVNGQEIVDGLLIPTGAIESDTTGKKNEGILTLNHSNTIVKPNMIANAVYEEFVLACKDVGIPIIQAVEDNANIVKPYKYNPLMQKKIVSGLVDKEAFKLGWAAYSQKLVSLLDKDLKILAVKKAETGRDDIIYQTLSGYIISILVINNKQGLGTQLRICCGDISKTEQFAKVFVKRIEAREQSHKSIAQGKLILGNAILSPSKNSLTISLYTNMKGYQAVPQFMGELLCNLAPGTFKPSLTNMIIGTDLNNEIVTAPFQKWLLPIIAGSRSGKGVLTLNILLNVVGLGTPLFYLDGKPDMAALLWKLQYRYGIQQSMVVDGIGYKGITDIDRKPYRAPYADSLEMALRNPRANGVLRSNFGVMVYLKTMLVILLANTYYKEQMGTQYGDMFVVFDEMYKVLVSQMQKLSTSIENAKAKLNKKENKNEIMQLEQIAIWIKTLANDYTGNDIGVFGNGIKAVALTQFAQVRSYGVQGFPEISRLCENFILKRAVKLFGRQEGGSGMYGVGSGSDKNTVLYQEYFHFGIGSEQGNTYDNLKTFKPLLVLNENDSKEYKEYRVQNHGLSAEELGGLGTDGAFVGDMLGRVAKYADVNEFRTKYFSSDPDLAGSIGFEGALDQIGRLLGVDWHQQLKLSLTRAYEISDAALRHYNIIGGIENINSVEDFICDLTTNTLLSYDDILTGQYSQPGQSGQMQSVFGDMEDISLTITDQYEVEDTPAKTHEHPEPIIKDNKTISYQDNTWQGERQASIPPRPQPIVMKGRETPIFDQSSDGLIHISSSESKRGTILTPENSIKVHMDPTSHIQANGSIFFQTLGGTNYNLKERWNIILDGIAKSIQPDLVTYVEIYEGAMLVNKKIVGTATVLGGEENIRIRDIVNYKMLAKRFKNIRLIRVDEENNDEMQYQFADIYQLFNKFKKLRSLEIVLYNGHMQRINREDIGSYEANSLMGRIQQNIAQRNQLEVACATRNKKLAKKGAPYKSKVWELATGFSGKASKVMTKELLDMNNSFFKRSTRALSVGVFIFGALSIGKTFQIIGSLMNKFKG